MAENCIFCKIIKGDIPSNKVYETDEVYCFLDINPVNEGHTLVIPKNHSPSLVELEELEVGKLFSVAKRIANPILSATNSPAYRIVTNVGAEAGQEVFHTHIHVIPYKKEKVNKSTLKSKLSETLANVQQALSAANL